MVEKKINYLFDYFFPADYANIEECKKYLYYKYGIDLSACQKITTKTCGMDFWKALYYQAKGYIEGFYPGLETKKSEEMDMLYLLLKEHLYFQLLSIKDKEDYSYNAVELSKAYATKGKEFSKTMYVRIREVEKDKYLEIVNRAEFKKLVSEKPYDMVAFNLIGLSHDNYIYLRVRNESKKRDINPSLEQLLKHDTCFDGKYITFEPGVAIMKSTLDTVFETTRSLMVQLYDKGELRHVWDEYEKEEQRVISIILYELFSKIYDDVVEHAYITEKDTKPYWNRLDKESLEEKKNNVLDRYIQFLITYDDVKRRKKGSFAKSEQWLEYAVKLNNAYMELVTDKFEYNSIKISKYLQTIWINESIFPTFSLLEFIESETVDVILRTEESLKETDPESGRKGVEYVSDVLFEVMNCPNIFCIKDIVNTDYVEFKDWVKKTKDEAVMLTKVYYPLLETVFHILCEQYFQDRKEFENYLLTIPHTFFESVYRESNSLFESVMEKKKLFDKIISRKKVFLSDSQSECIKNYAEYYTLTYGDSPKKMQKVDIPIKQDYAYE